MCKCIECEHLLKYINKTPDEYDCIADMTFSYRTEDPNEEQGKLSCPEFDKAKTKEKSRLTEGEWDVVIGHPYGF